MSQFPPAPTRPRLQWKVLARRGVFGWELVREGQLVRTYLFKYRAVEAAAAACHFELDVYGWHSELTIYTRKHLIEDRRTYGADPRRTKG